MKIRRRQMPDQSRTPCWCPNRRRARRRRVSSPDCAADARPHSRREQHPQSAAPWLIGGESPLRARVLASSFSAAPRLTAKQAYEVQFNAFLTPFADRLPPTTKLARDEKL